MEIEGIELTTFAEIAEQVGCHPVAVWWAARACKVPMTKVGRSWLIERRSVPVIESAIHEREATKASRRRTIG